jgi:radical SAM-linked protein
MAAEPAARWLIEVVYRKTGPALLVGHLDVLRAFERALRRAGLPIAHTEGFNPRPKIVFASPLGVGASGDEERACLTLERPMEPVDVLKALGPRMQPGIELHQACALPGRKPPPYHLIPWADWRVSLPPDTADHADLDRRCADLLARPEMLVERERKGKKRTLDIRPAIETLQAAGDDQLAMRLQMDAGPTVKPVEVVEALGLPTGSEHQPHPISRRERLAPTPEA